MLLVVDDLMPRSPSHLIGLLKHPLKPIVLLLVLAVAAINSGSTPQSLPGVAFPHPYIQGITEKFGHLRLRGQRAFVIHIMHQFFLY